MITPINEDRTLYILLVGQSQLANYLKPDNHTTEVTWEVDIEGNWHKANTPMGLQNSLDGSIVAKNLPSGNFPTNGNLMANLGDYIVKNNAGIDRVKIVNINVGGTKIKWWLKNTHPELFPNRDDDFFPYDDFADTFNYNLKKYPQLYQRVMFAKWLSYEQDFKYDFIIYHQGESDGFEGTNGSEYEKDLRMFLKDVHEVFQTDIFVCQASYVLGEKWNYITQIQKKIFSDTPYIREGINTDKYNSTLRHDNIHFNQDGIDRFVKEIYAKLNGCNRYSYNLCELPIENSRCRG